MRNNTTNAFICRNVGEVCRKLEQNRPENHTFFLQMLRATRAAILSESPDNGEDVGIERATPFKPPPRAKYLTIATILGPLSNSPRGYVW